jgi:hypothetical protein
MATWCMEFVDANHSAFHVGESDTSPVQQNCRFKLAAELKSL